MAFIYTYFLETLLTLSEWKLFNKFIRIFSNIKSTGSDQMGHATI